MAGWPKPTTTTSKPWAPERCGRAKPPTHPGLSLNERQSLVVFSHCIGLLLKQLKTYLFYYVPGRILGGGVCSRQPKIFRSFTPYKSYTSTYGDLLGPMYEKKDYKWGTILGARQQTLKEVRVFFFNGIWWNQGKHILTLSKKLTA